MTVRGPRETLATLGWGLFCACSWTWCIGMFLPRIMLERYGWMGFAAFAIPNVVGCAGFGYVLWSSATSRALVARHTNAMAVFSSVAIAFHMMFLGWLATSLWPAAAAHAWAGPALVGGVFVVGAATSFLGDRAWPAAAIAVWVFSALVFVRLATHDGLAIPPPTGTLGSLAWLAPIVAIGFMLCPYLDLTFHRALQRSPSRHAFGVFGAGFTVMILLTPFVWFGPGPVPVALAAAHLLAQATFTVGAHLRELRTAPLPAGSRAALSFGPLVAAGLVPAAAALLPGTADPGPDLYLRFLVFYGLAFPAYVLLRMGPARPLAAGGRATLALLLVIAAFAPFYEAAFIHEHTAWIAIPTAAAALWIITRRRPAPTG